MTEQEWLECTDLRRMLKYLEGKASERKWRLMATGCCRMIWHLLKDPRSRRAVEAAEDFADGWVDAEQLAARHDESAQVSHAVQRAEAHAATDVTEVKVHPLQVGWLATWALVRSRVKDVSRQLVAREAAEKAARTELAHLLRRIAGNPYRPLNLDPAWLAWNDGTVRRLAEAIYRERAFDRMPILADAMEDAGCEDEQILTHLRGPGPHARGCCVLDQILDKK